MDAGIKDSPSTLQQYLGFTTTHKRFESDHNLFTFPLVHFTPLRTFARNFSNIDFFLKILLLKDHELAMSET